MKIKYFINTIIILIFIWFFKINLYLFIISMLLVIISYLFISYKKFKYGLRMFDEQTMKICENIKDKLKKENIKIKILQCYKLNNIQHISFQYNFSKSWISGVVLNFDIKDGFIKFRGYGGFGFRNKKYETEENKKTLENIINKIENINI